MAAKKEKPIRLDELTQEEKMKYEIADELGLLDLVLREGWKSLSSKETGRIGGVMTKRIREMQNHDKNITNVNECEYLIQIVENRIFICYNRKTGNTIGR